MLGIVIVNYNGEKFQNDCIDSLLKQTYQDFKIIIVDNGSSDKSMELLDKFATDKIIKIYNNDNLGVAVGNNVGIKKSIELGCEYTLLLNNDTFLLEDSLEKLMIGNKDVVSPMIYYYNTKKIWYYGGRFNKSKGTITHLNYQKENYKKLSVTKYAPTCCLLIKNSVFEKIGLFDENYFLYYDDVDFCYRLKENHIKIYITDDSIIYHKVSLSSGGENSKTAIYYNNRNRLYYIDKTRGIYKVLAKIYTYITRKLTRKNSEIIKIAIDDYKKKHMGRKDW